MDDPFLVSFNLYCVGCAVFIVFCPRKFLLKVLDFCGDYFSPLILIGAVWGGTRLIQFVFFAQLGGLIEEDAERRGLYKGLSLIPALVLFFIFLNWKTKRISEPKELPVPEKTILGNRSEGEKETFKIGQCVKCWDDGSIGVVKQVTQSSLYISFIGVPSLREVNIQRVSLSDEPLSFLVGARVRCMDDAAEVEIMGNHGEYLMVLYPGTARVRKVPVSLIRSSTDSCGEG